MSETASTTTQPAITARVLDALVAVEAAELFGLPTPFAVSATDYGIVELQVHTKDEWNTWTERIAGEQVMHAGSTSTVYYATGEIAGVTVRIAYCEPES